MKKIFKNTIDIALLVFVCIALITLTYLFSSCGNPNKLDYKLDTLYANIEMLEEEIDNNSIQARVNLVDYTITRRGDDAIACHFWFDTSAGVKRVALNGAGQATFSHKYAELCATVENTTKKPDYFFLTIYFEDGSVEVINVDFNYEF